MHSSIIFIEVFVPSKFAVYMFRGVDFASVSTSFRRDFGTVPTMWYFCFSFYFLTVLVSNIYTSHRI